MTKRTNCVCYLYERKPRTEIMIAKVGVELADELVWSGKGNEKVVEIYYYQENTAGSCLVKWPTEVSGDVVELFIVIFIPYTRVLFGERIRPGAFGRPGGKTPSERFSLFSSAGIPRQRRLSRTTIYARRRSAFVRADVFFRFRAVSRRSRRERLTANRFCRPGGVDGGRRQKRRFRFTAVIGTPVAHPVSEVVGRPIRTRTEARSFPARTCDSPGFLDVCPRIIRPSVSPPQTRPLTVTFGQPVDD